MTARPDKTPNRGLRKKKNYRPLKMAGIAIACLVATTPPALSNPREWRERAIECIAITVYAESRGEPIEGKSAVAWTIMNRVRATGADPCTVVLSPEQFIALNPAPLQSYLRNIATGMPYGQAYAHNAGNHAALEEARSVARAAYHGLGRDTSNGALNFIAAEWEHRVSPGHWSRFMSVTARIANHIFLRPPSGKIATPVAIESNKRPQDTPPIRSRILDEKIREILDNPG